MPIYVDVLPFFFDTAKCTHRYFVGGAHSTSTSKRTLFVATISRPSVPFKWHLVGLGVAAINMHTFVQLKYENKTEKNIKWKMQFFALATIISLILV